VVPHRTPERGQVVDRPAPQGRVAVEGQAALRLEPREVAADLRALPDIGRRRPQDVTLAHAGLPSRIVSSTSAAPPSPPRWLSPWRTKNCAPGMRGARCRPCANGMM
jgi:hypothetical protein